MIRTNKTTTNEFKARVFISCGQKGSEEKKTADDIKKLLKRKGYEYYLSARQKDLKTLKEKTFQALSSSEYILFIDFKREKLGFFSKRRGSL